MPSTFAVTPCPAGGTFIGPRGTPRSQLTGVPVATFEMVVVPATVIGPEPAFVPPDPQPAAANPDNGKQQQRGRLHLTAYTPPTAGMSTRCPAWGHSKASSASVAL